MSGTKPATLAVPAEFAGQARLFRDKVYQADRVLSDLMARILREHTRRMNNGKLYMRKQTCEDFLREWRAWVCGHWTHTLGFVRKLSTLWRDRLRACVYAVAGVSGASVTAKSCFGIGMASFFSSSASVPAIFVR